MNMIIMSIILIVCAVVLLTPFVFAIIDRIFWNNHVKHLNEAHETRVQCITCHNYKIQSEMYFLDQCFDCYDIIVGDINHG